MKEHAPIEPRGNLQHPPAEVRVFSEKLKHPAMESKSGIYKNADTIRAKTGSPTLHDNINKKFSKSSVPIRYTSNNNIISKHKISISHGNKQGKPTKKQKKGKTKQNSRQSINLQQIKTFLSNPSYTHGSQIPQAVNHYSKGVHKDSTDVDTPYVHYIRKEVLPTYHKHRQPVYKPPKPAVHKVIDVSGFDNDDDDDDDDDDNTNILLLRNEEQSGLSRKEEAIYKSYINNKRQEQYTIESNNDNLREKKDVILHDENDRRKRSEFDKIKGKRMKKTKAKGI